MNRLVFKVQFHLGWTSLDSEETEPISPNSLEMCHPLCQCKKCSQVQKVSLWILKNYLNNQNFRIACKSDMPLAQMC